MIIDLEPVFNNVGSVRDISYELDLSGESFEGMKPFSSPVKVNAVISNRAGIVEINGEADMVINTVCDRCAKPLDYEHNTVIGHTLVADLNNKDNDELYLVKDYKLDVDELVSEDIFLDFPVKFLCSDDCKGLCPKCGKDLNYETCSCKKDIDPRWAVLEQLLDK